ncbi:acylneuraminate cytidylyltransferase family protein [Terasakiella sp. SH-1]|uniref:acylneuraminate cytidylyltransferase family protein n=1 Tax=Terasakiella sp. SH-1 TaxID=2560057 RepID=UPI0010739D71|nr:acylneuraminate cytidylyltransferase family protein [Terasakiella sp. SH-1]
MFAYIPARGGSQRIPRKNIRELDGTPIIGHVINHLKELDFLSNVYVSTDDEEIAEVARSYGAETLELRSPDLADSISGFTDLIRHDIPRFMKAEENDHEVLFCLATAALVPAEIYLKAYEQFKKDEPEVLMSCEPFHEPAFWAMTQKEDGFWYPLFPDKVLINSQDLEPTITDSGLFYFFDQRILAQYDCHKLANKLQAFLVPHGYSCDINNEADWERLEWKYERLQRKTTI